LTGAGNMNSIIWTERAIKCFDPRIILFVGVAGGIQGVSIDDIVIGTKSYYYEYGKEAEDGFSPRGSAQSYDENLLNLLKKQIVKQDLLTKIREKWGDTDIIFAPIASGEKVIASRGSYSGQILKDVYNDAVAVEMEGYGFLKAIDYNSERVVKAMTIRGISDMLDDKNSLGDVKQKITARKVAEFVILILPYIILTDTDTVEVNRLKLEGMYFNQLLSARS
ncbi:MAG: hypothetical protein AAF502_25640, partial [Bacteroidota bacterium]